MKTRVMLTLALLLTTTAACTEGPEREEGPENEAAEMAETAPATRNGMIELPADLLARATVNVKDALATALASVPGGRISAGELEEEDGALIYSFDIAVEGQEGIEEVQVDALTGKVTSQEHESAEDEAAEAAEEGGH